MRNDIDSKGYVFTYIFSSSERYIIKKILYVLK